MAIRVSEVTVDFHGGGAGIGELTWGQLGIWRTAQATGRTMNLVTPLRLAKGTSLDEMVALLRFMVSRHPVLRTRLRFPDGPAAAPWQVVAGSGEVPLHIADIDDEDPVAVAEQLRSRYELTPFDYPNEFPVRMAVVRQAGALRMMVIGFSHVMLDGAAHALLNGDAKQRESGAPPPVLDPLELACAQHGPVGDRQTSRCLRYWDAQLRRLTAWANDPPPAPAAPRFQELVMYSPAMAIAMQAIEVRTRANSTAVLLAAYAVAVARVLGRDPAVAQLVVSNRFRPGFADAILQLSQHGICVIDADAATFDEVVARAAMATTNAAFYAYYDPARRDALLDEVAGQLGRPLDISWHLNDRRVFPLPDAGGAATAPEVAAALGDALPRTKLYWDRALPMFDGSLFIQVDSAAEYTIAGRTALDDGRPAVYLEVWVDTQRFSLDQTEAFARQLETVVAQAAMDPTLRRANR